MTTYLEYSALACCAVVLAPFVGAKGVRWSAAAVVAAVVVKVLA